MFYLMVLFLHKLEKFCTKKASSRERQFDWLIDWINLLNDGIPRGQSKITIDEICFKKRFKIEP